MTAKPGVSTPLSQLPLLSSHPIDVPKFVLAAMFFVLFSLVYVVMASAWLLSSRLRGFSRPLLAAKHLGSTSQSAEARPASLRKLDFFPVVESYVYAAAMTSISTRASLGSRATWTVERAGGA